MDCRPYFKTLTYTLIFFISAAQASIIESTIGAAVVNDATATYFNPGALILVPNPQAIPLVSFVDARNQFRGITIQRLSNYTQQGQAGNTTNLNLPTFYIAVPTTKNITLGIGFIYNAVSNHFPNDSMLRYVLPHNRLQALDIAPAFGIKLNQCFSLGAGVSLSHVHLENKLLNRGIIRGNNIQSINSSSGHSQGAYFGILYKPNKYTLIGATYRSRIKYQLHGHSTLETSPPLISNNFRTSLSVPARYVFSISHFFNATFGTIATVQLIEWRSLKDVSMEDVAAEVGGSSVIIPAVTIPKKRHDSWIATAGIQYRVQPSWIWRTALSYNQDSGNPHYEVTQGDSLLIAISSGYDFNKYTTVDVGYIHSFVKNRSINIKLKNITQGINHGWTDAASIKITFNIV